MKVMTRGSAEHSAYSARQSFWLGAALIACDASSSGGVAPSADQAPPPHASRLCPACVAGGETTDFAGDSTCELAKSAALEQDDALAQEFGVDAVLARLEEPLHSSLRWRKGMGGSVVTGYERETEIDLRVDVLGLSHLAFVDLRDGSACGEYLEVAANVQVSTADGALSGSFERPFRIQRGSQTAHLDTHRIEDATLPIDLRDFAGTLDLQLDAERAPAGSVSVSLVVAPDAIHGTLGVEISYFDPDRGRYSEWLDPIWAQWPSADCDPGWVSIDPDTPINPPDGRSARDNWASYRERIDAAYPTPATWLDGKRTEIDLELGEIESACRNRFGPSSYFNAALRIRTADGQLTTTHLAHVYEDVFESVTVEGEPTARDAFMEQVSAPGIEWGNDFEAKLELVSRLEEDAAPGGSVNVIGFDGEGHNRLYLNWCSQTDCTGIIPGPESR